jgi:hypothetical protein
VVFWRVWVARWGLGGAVVVDYRFFFLFFFWEVLLGGGCSPRTLSRRTVLGALAFAGPVLPDATLRGMRSSRSHGGIAPTVAGWSLSSEASSPGSVAPCRERRAGRGADTPASLIFTSAPLPRGRRRLLTGRWPRVTGLASYLSGCVRFAVG